MRKSMARLRKSMLVMFISMLICLLSGVLLVQASAVMTIPVCVSGTEHYGMAWEILSLVNVERAKEGLTPLEMDTELLDYAMLRAAECVVNYSHTRPDGTDFFIGMPGSGWRSENIAVGYTSAESVVRAWMNSSGHHANIMQVLSSSIGIGVYYAYGRYYYAQLFAESSAMTVTQSNVSVPKTVNVNTSIEDVLPTVHETPKTYNLIVGTEESLDLPNIFIQKSEWSVQVLVDENYLEYEISDSSIATISGANLRTAKIQAVGEGNTELKIFVNGDSSKAITFEIIVRKNILGDVNGDGVINIMDIMAVRNYIFGIRVLSAEELLAADVDRNGVVDIFDIMKIRDHIFGKALLW